MSNQDKKVGIVTMEKYEGKESVGSSRIRGRWVSKYWDDAEVHIQGKDYDVTIYQKAYWIEHAKRFDGIQILDLCDPSWYEWGNRVKQTMVHCDAVTTSTEELAKSVRKFADDETIVRHIPDRMDLDWHEEHKEHHDREAEIAAWYGYSQNFPMLKPALRFLDKMDLKLIVVSNKKFMMPPQYADKIDYINYTYDVDTINENLCKADLVLNPQSSHGKWRFKSNNKTISANLLNLPVAHNLEELKELMNPDTRKEEAEKQRKHAEQNYDVRKSAEDYKELLEDIKKRNN